MRRAVPAIAGSIEKLVAAAEVRSPLGHPAEHKSDSSFEAAVIGGARPLLKVSDYVADWIIRITPDTDHRLL